MMGAEVGNATMDHGMQESIGASLKRLREQQGKSLEEVALEINRRVEELQRIEAEDLQSLVHESAAVYVRGTISNFARCLQMPRKDMERLLKRFKQEVESEESQPLAITQANIASENRSLRRGHLVPLLRLLLPLIIFILAASQVLNSDSWVLRKVRETFPSNKTVEVVSGSQEIVLDQNTTTNNAQEITLVTPERGEQATQTESALPTSSTTVAVPLTLESSPATSTVSTTGSDTQEPSLTLESTQETPTTALVNPESETPAPATETAVSTSAAIRLEVLNDVWFEINNAKKKRVHTGTFKKGTVLELDADGAPYQLSLGKPSALKVEISGQSVQLPKLLMRGTKNQYLLKVE